MAMAQMNAVLEEFAGISVFLEEVAMMTNPVMRYTVISNGFQDLEDLLRWILSMPS
jgi:hypothetical protein